MVKKSQTPAVSLDAPVAIDAPHAVPSLFDAAQTAPTLAQALQSYSKHDIVSALLAMVMAELPADTVIPPACVKAINQKIRTEWGGARVTIHAKNPIDIDHRRDQICWYYTRGASVDFLGRKFDLSTDRIYQIIKARDGN